MDDDTISRLKLNQQITERPFRSDVPIVGGLIVRFRMLWNSISTLWYVRPLIQQQNEFNAALVQALEQHLSELDAHLLELDERLVDLDYDQVALAHTLAGLQYKVIQLSHRESQGSGAGDASDALLALEE